jgi:ABC-2 type transport system permease protein
VKNELSPGAARLRAFTRICISNFRLFFREPEAVFWTFFFPLMLSIALGLAFREKPAEVVPVAVVAGPRAEALAEKLKGHRSLKVSVEDEERAALDLRMGRVAVVVAPGSVTSRLGVGAAPRQRGHPDGGRPARSRPDDSP